MLHMHTIQNPNLLHFLTHCEYLLWLGLGLVRSHHKIIIRVGRFVERFLRTPASPPPEAGALCGSALRLPVKPRVSLG